MSNVMVRNWVFFWHLSRDSQIATSCDWHSLGKYNWQDIHCALYLLAICQIVCIDASVSLSLANWKAKILFQWKSESLSGWLQCIARLCRGKVSKRGVPIGFLHARQSSGSAEENETPAKTGDRKLHKSSGARSTGCQPTMTTDGIWHPPWWAFFQSAMAIICNCGSWLFLRRWKNQHYHLHFIKF